jgi:hypothetical protein
MIEQKFFGYSPAFPTFFSALTEKPDYCERRLKTMPKSTVTKPSHPQRSKNKPEGF